jgi:hypothetical protein
MGRGSSHAIRGVCGGHSRVVGVSGAPLTKCRPQVSTKLTRASAASAATSPAWINGRLSLVRRPQPGHGANTGSITRVTELALEATRPASGRASSFQAWRGVGPLRTSDSRSSRPIGCRSFKWEYACASPGERYALRQKANRSTPDGSVWNETGVAPKRDRANSSPSCSSERWMSTHSRM